MAITGTKLFTSGEILTSNDVNQYLARGVKVFGSAAIRDAAYGGAGEPTLEEGETCYLADTDTVLVYNGSTWVTVGPVVRAIDANYVETSQATSSTTYVDLATAGPSVTLDTSTSAIVIISGRGNDDANDGATAVMSWAVSGATTIAASDSWSWQADQAAFRSFGTNIYKVTTLTPGSNTFTAKYKKAGGSTSSFAYRGMMVIAL